MNNTLEYIIPAVCGVIGIGIGIGFYAFWATQKLNSTTQRAKKVMEDADREVIAKRKELAIQVKEELYQTRARFEKETKEQRRELKERGETDSWAGSEYRAKTKLPGTEGEQDSRKRTAFQRAGTKI